MNPTDAEPIDPKSIRIVASFPDVQAASEAARWPLLAQSVEERAAALAAQHEDRPFPELSIRQQVAYTTSVKNQDAQAEKKAAAEAAEQRLVDIERRLEKLEQRVYPGPVDMSGYL
jgi:hypothetical protein